VTEPLAQSRVIAPGRLMLERGAVPPGETAEAALREPNANGELVHGGSAGLGLQNFFASNSLSTMASRA
jgi:hypothetical protein